MCGICGKINFDRDEPVDPGLVRRMADAIAHRGPDGWGLHVVGEIGLGHRRLSIIDLSTGDQPMCNEDGSVWVVFNGEIYNFAEQRRDLERRGHQFKSTSDTEVIVHLYEEFGDRCVERLQGMFSFALWDQSRRRLLLARDRIGIKPLYYAANARSLSFGSEIKSIFADESMERTIDPTSVDRFLTYYYMPGSETLYEGVRKLDPGHYLTVEQGVVRITRYWDLEFEEPMPAPSMQRSVEQLRALLDETVKSHMISDVPVGVLLSGGVDSTAVLSHARRHSHAPLHTFTMGFAGTDVPDERPYARLAAERMGTRHAEITMSARDFRDFLPRYAWHMEEPVCEPPAIALYHLAATARREGIKVLLSGEGGDEAFAGYQTYRNLLALEALKARLGPARPILGWSLRTLAMLGSQRARHYGGLVDPELADYYFSRASTPNSDFNRLKQTLYRPALAGRLRGLCSDAPTQALHARVARHGMLNRMLYVDSKSWLPDDLLVKADKMTMATSVELRVPLLDHRILEFAAGLPRAHKASGWSLKRVLREALKDQVPTEILTRPKAGFPVPYGRWMRGELNGYVRDTVLARGSLIDRLFERRPVEQLLDAHQRTGAGTKEVFSLLVLNLCHQAFDTRSGFAAVRTPTFARPEAGEATGLREAIA